MTRRPRGGLAALLLLALSAPARADTNAILLLLHDERPPLEAALVDSLHIYTRDLGFTIIEERGAPTALSEAELSRAIDRGRAAGSRLVVWLDGAGARAALVALDVTTRDLWRTLAGDADPEGGARALSLRLRALIAPGVPLAPPKIAPPPVEDKPAPPPVEVKPPQPVEVKPAVPPQVEVKPAPPHLEVAPAARPSPPAQFQLEISLGLGVITSGDLTWARYGLTLRVAWPWRRFAIFADASLSSQPDARFDDGTHATLSDLPIGLGALYRWRRGRLLLEGGPRASVHFEAASATALDGRTVGNTTFVGVGLGLAGQARWDLSEHLAATVLVGAEAMLRYPEFMIDDGRAGPDPGAWTVSLAVGVVFAAP